MCSRRRRRMRGNDLSSGRLRTGRAIAATRGAGPRAVSSVSCIATGSTGSRRSVHHAPRQAREGALSRAGTRQLLCMGLFSIFWQRASAGNFATGDTTNESAPGSDPGAPCVEPVRCVGCVNRRSARRCRSAGPMRPASRSLPSSRRIRAASRPGSWPSSRLPCSRPP